MGGSIARSRGRAAYRRAAYVGGVHNTVEPVITGTAQVGQTLTVDDGTWAGEAATYERQWKSDSSDVGDGSQTYVPVVGDVGKPITCEVKATTARGGTATAVSNATANVIA